MTLPPASPPPQKTDKPIIWDAYVEWPCDCRGTALVRVGIGCTHDPIPYVFTVTCKVCGRDAVAIGVNAPEGGILPEWVTAIRAALRRLTPPLRLRWRRINHDKDREVICPGK